MTDKYEFVPGDEITIAPGRTVKRIRALVAIATFGVAAGDVGGYVENVENLSQVSGNARVYGDAWVSGNAWVYGNARVYGDALVSGNARVYGNAWVDGNARVYGNVQVSGNARVYGNVQVSGNAWVYGNARVYGDAWVSGNARVYGNAWVSGNAQVSGDAWVSGNARVYGNAWVYGDAWVSGNAQIVWFSKVGRDNGTLTVFKDKDGQLIATRGCFIGTIDEFLSKSEAEHDDKTHLEYRLLIEVAYSRLTK